MEKDRVLWQLAMLINEQEKKIESVKRARSLKVQRPLLIQQIKVKIEALNIALIAVKGAA